MLNRILKKLLNPILVTTILGVILFVYYVFITVLGNVQYNDFMTSIDRKIVDYILKYRGAQKVSNKVALIAVDGQSINELGRWPWPRSIIADMVDILREHYKVSVIGFDIVFSEPDQTYLAVKDSLKDLPKNDVNDNFKNKIFVERDYDTRLAKTIDKWDNIVSGYFFRNDIVDGEYSDSNISENIAAISSMKIPIVIFNNDAPKLEYIHSSMIPEVNIFSHLNKNNKTAGFFSITPDPDDGIVRRVESFFRLKDNYYPSLALAMYQKYLQKIDPAGYHEFSIEFDKNGYLNWLSIGEKKYSVDAEATFRINYRGPVNTITHYSFIDVLKKKYSVEELQGKLVYIGVTELGVYDIRSTPVGAEFPGLEVQGNILENLISDNFLVQSSTTHSISLLEILLACLFLLIVKKLRSDLWGDLLIFIFGLAIVIFNYYMFDKYNLVISYAFPILALFGSWIYTILFYAITEGQDKRFIKSAFSQYLAPKVIDQLINDPSQLKLGGNRKELTIFFSDLQGFSSISEKYNVVDLTAILNDYLTKMVNVIMKYEGTVDKFEGDAIIAFWGAPIDSEQHHINACKATIEMQNVMKEFRVIQAQKKQLPFIMRVGINTGEVMVGNFGSQQRMDYTVIGDAANLASRLEGVNKIYGTQSMISEKTYKFVADIVETRLLDEIMVVGKDEPIKIYELIDFKGKISEDEKWKITTYQNAFALYRQKEFDQAFILFESIVEKLGDDVASKVFMGRIAEFKITPPPENWAGTFRLTSK